MQFPDLFIAKNKVEKKGEYGKIVKITRKGMGGRKEKLGNGGKEQKKVKITR